MHQSPPSPTPRESPCRQTFLFTAVVAATAPGAVAYQWESSDGTKSAAAALIFPVGNLTQTVTYQAIFSQSGEYSMRLRVVPHSHRGTRTRRRLRQRVHREVK